MSEFLNQLTDREREILLCLVEDLSNADIALRLHLTQGTVRWYNSQIYSKLGVNNRREAIAQVKTLDLSRSRALQEPVMNNLPAQMTAFIGREQELLELHQLFYEEKKRFVTILAPGGMGKTRLALALGHQFVSTARHFNSGIFFVPLQNLSEPEQIVPQIANSIGYQFIGNALSSRQQLVDYLVEKICCY